MEMNFEERIALLNKIVNECNNIVFFGGAGVSTESGIPDFRSKDGLYNTLDADFSKYEPEYLLSHTCLYKEPKIFYSFYKQKMDVRDIKPNITHIKLAELEQAGKNIEIVTQNIDGLHQKAGSKKVYEIHGTTARNHCSYCKKEYPSDYIFTSEELIPKCPDCGHIIRPDVTLYEEDLPLDACNNAVRAIAVAECMIIAGTSLSVYPAAGYVNYFRGKYLVIINRESTGNPVETWCDLIFRESCGEVMSRIALN